MKIVVDTNIVFSAILTPNGKIGRLLGEKPDSIDYIAPSFLLDELQLHLEKILKITKYSKEQYERIKKVVIRNIKFVDITNISKINQNKATNALSEIDIKDIPFLALAYEEDSYLWTGDKKLIQGLGNMYSKILTTDILYAQYF